MTDTTLTDAIVFPQDPGTGVASADRDWVSAGFMGLSGQSVGGSYVANGFEFANVDTANDEVDITAGHAYIIEEGISVQSEGGSGAFDAVFPAGSDHAYCVVLKSDLVDLSLASGNNDMYLAVDPTTPDTAYIRHGTSVSAPTDPYIKIGEVNTTTEDTVRNTGLPKPFTPNGFTLSDINDAIDNHDHVKLIPGATYSGSTSITVAVQDRDVTLEAWGATIDYTGSGVCLDIESNNENSFNGHFTLHGGWWDGANGTTPTGIRVTDSCHHEFYPTRVDNWDKGIFFRNVDSFSEDNMVVCRKMAGNTEAIVFHGVDTTGGSTGTNSFKGTQLDVTIAGGTNKGIVQSDASVYDSFINARIFVDTGGTGWTIDNGNTNTLARIGIENAGGSGGTGILIESDTTQCPFLINPWFNNLTNDITNNSTAEIVSSRIVDGEYQMWIDNTQHFAITPDETTFLEEEVRVQRGTAGSTTTWFISELADGTERLHVRENTDGTVEFDVRTSGERFSLWNNGDADYADLRLQTSVQKSTRLIEEDLTQRSPLADEVAKHDGSGAFSESVCFDVAGEWYNIIDGSTM